MMREHLQQDASCWCLRKMLIDKHMYPKMTAVQREQLHTPSICLINVVFAAGCLSWVLHLFVGWCTVLLLAGCSHCKAHCFDLQCPSEKQVWVLAGHRAGHCSVIIQINPLNNHSPNSTLQPIGVTTSPPGRSLLAGHRLHWGLNGRVKHLVRMSSWLLDYPLCFGGLVKCLVEVAQPQFPEIQQFLSSRCPGRTVPEVLLLTHSCSRQVHSHVSIDTRCIGTVASRLYARHCGMHPAIRKCSREHPWFVPIIQHIFQKLWRQV